MRLSISNIAWDIHEDPAVAKLLNMFAVDAIDVAPSKYFPDPKSAKDLDIANIRQWWADQGIEIIGMQALLFGTTGLNIFGDNKCQKEMLHHLEAICRIASALGATRLVFGSPKNRDRSDLSDLDSLEIAVNFFQRLGDIAKRHNVIICLEPNPEKYGANFMTNCIDTANVVTHVAHDAIFMQFDTGAITIKNEKPETVLQGYAGLIGHIHASEPDLIPFGDGETDHHLTFRILKDYLPKHVVTIEMVATKTEPHIQSIERALRYATKCVRSTEDF